MFENMSFIEGIGDEVTFFFLILITLLVVYIGWISTNVPDFRIIRTTVGVIDNSHRRLMDRVVQHPLTLSILRSSSTHSTSSNTTEEIEVEDNSASSPVEEASNIAEPPNLSSVWDEIAAFDLVGVDEDNGPEEIIREMDEGIPSDVGLRHRRINVVNSNRSQSFVEGSDLIDSTVTNIIDNEPSNTDNCENENNENSNLTRNISELNEPNLDIHKISTNTNSTTNGENIEDLLKSCKQDEMRIKLKSLNDEMTLVSAVPSETIGEFKKRNFTTELAAQKCVRLVFNGHVLQPDTKTLQACGLFDNCVVHCLVHNRKAQPNTNDGNNGNISGNRMNDSNENSNFHLPSQPQMARERTENGPLLVYLIMCLISLVLVCGWYCRFRYNFLFSWYSTTGLVLLTVLFLVMIPLNVLIERENSG